MSTAEGTGEQADCDNKTGTQVSGSGASCKPAKQESLEDQLRLLHSQINNSDWLQKNTADMWMESNPEAAAELKKIIAEKQASQHAPQTAGSESSGGDSVQKS